MACDKAIMIEGVDEDEREDILLLFETERRTGGGLVASDEYFEAKRTIVIFYEDSKTAERVLKRTEAVENGLKTYLPKKVTPSELEVLRRKVTVDESNQIFVESVSEEDIEIVKMLFENERKSGGGLFQNHVYIRGERRLIINFLDPACVVRTVKRGAVTFKDKQWRAQSKTQETLNSPLARSSSGISCISKLDPTSDKQFDNFKLKITIHDTMDSNVTVDDETFQLYLNCLLKEATFCRINYDIDVLRKNQEYLVTCARIFDFESVLLQHRRTPKVLGKVVEIERLKEIKSIIVKSKENSDIVELYFQNEKQSGGGDIQTFKKLDFVNDEFNIFLIEFEDAKCIDRVFAKTHRPGMKVHVLYDEVDPFLDQVALQIKERNITILKELVSIELDADKFPFSFITQRQKYLDILIELVSKNKGEMSISENRLKIKYQKFNGQFIEEFKNSFSFNEWIVGADLLQKLKSDLSELYITDSNVNLCFDENEDQATIRIEGDAIAVKSEIGKISCIVNTAVKKIDEKVKNLKEYQCALLLSCGFIKEVKSKSPSISIKINPLLGTICFNGHPESIISANQILREKLNSIVHEEKIVNYSIAKFLTEKKDFVAQELEKNKLICEYEIILDTRRQTATESDLINYRDAIIHYYALDIEELHKASKFIGDTFVEFKHELCKESLELLDSTYPVFLQQIEDGLKYSKKQDHVMFVSSKSNREVLCVGHKLLIKNENLSKRILDFFEMNTELSTYCDLPDEDLRYLAVVKHKEIPNVCMNIQKLMGCSASVTHEHNPCDLVPYRLKLAGNKRVIEKLNEEFQTWLTKKVFSFFEVNDSSVFDLFTSERGVKNLLAIESSNECLIINSNDHQISPAVKPLIGNTSSVDKCVHRVSILGININVVNSSLDRFEYADVITVSSESDLRPIDKISKAIVDKTNGLMLPEIKRILYANCINEGGAYSINLQQLKFCKCIVHAILPKNIEDSRVKPTLQACIENIMQKTDKFNSIAISLLYADRLDCQAVRTNVIDSLIYAIFSYLFDFPETSLKEIYIVDDKYANLVVDALNCFFAGLNKLDALNEKSSADIKDAQIKVETGNILNIKSTVDAIVNTTNRELSLNKGTVSKLILEKAGAGIQKELNDNYPNHLTEDCLVAVSSGGNITNIKYIFHISLNSYDNNNETKCKQAFKKMIKQILIEATSKGCKSIAIPAIGTGVLMYPRDKVAKWMFKEINNYFSLNKNTSLKHVVIVLYDKDMETINEFRRIQAQNENTDSLKNGKASNGSDAKITENNFYSNLTMEEKALKMKFESVYFEVYLGNICAATDQVIINPTNTEFQLDGNVAKAIQLAAGNVLRDELGPSPKLNKNRVFWTNAGGLQAKKILHVDVTNVKINECIKNSLEVVNQGGYQSVVYPVIGTGNLQMDKNIAVKEILEGIALFIRMAKNGKTLNIKSIKVCIYDKQEAILQIFKNEMTQLINQNTFEPVPWYAKFYYKTKMLFSKAEKICLTNETKEALPAVKSKILRFKLVSNDEKKIEQTKKQLTDMLNQDKMSEMLSHEHISLLNAQQNENLIAICKANYVKAVIDRDLGKIKLIGRTKNVTKSLSELNIELNIYMKKSLEKAQEIARDIQWEACANTNKWTPYNIYLNAKIEEAYQKKHNDFTFQDENGENCVIDFHTSMQIIRRRNYVIRRVHLKNRLEFMIPDCWDNSKNCDLVTLDSKSKEFQEVLVQLNDNTFANRTIVSIERVQNQRLYIQYQAHKKHFEERDLANVNERILYHGTTSDTFEQIWKTGFNRSYAGKNATVYGKGVYFARDASYSHRYTNLGTVGRKSVQNIQQAHLFVCKVLIGYSAVGTQNTETKNLPKAPDGVTAVDSTVDSIQTPTIIVIYHDAQVYPEYLVTYK